MFINLTVRKGQDFYITSSEVELERSPHRLNESNIEKFMQDLADAYADKGWSVELTREAA